MSFFAIRKLGHESTPAESLPLRKDSTLLNRATQESHMWKPYAGPDTEARPPFPPQRTTGDRVIPWPSSERFPKGRVQPVVSAADLERVKATASGAVSLRTQFIESERKKKLELHEQSVKKYSSWDNTVMGLRARRLAATKQKQEDLENERKKMDEAWATIRQAEKQAILERARTTQLLQNSRYRDVLSMLKEMNAIKERELQIQHNKELSAMRKLQDNAYLKWAKIHEEEAIKREQEKEEAARKRVQEVRDYQLQQIKEERARKGAAKKVPEDEKLDPVTMMRELEAKKRKAAEVKAAFAQQFSQDMEKLIAQKQEAKRIQAEEDAELARRNQAFVESRAYIKERCGQFHMENIKERMALSEQVSKLQVEAAEEASTKYKQYFAITKTGKMDFTHLEDLHNHAPVVTQDAVNQTNSEMMKKKAEERESRKGTVKEDLEADLARVARERGVIEAAKEKAHQKVHDIAKFNRVLAGEKAKERQDKLDNKAVPRQEMLQKKAEEDAVFDAFVQKSITDFAAKGHNVEPLVRNFVHRKHH